MKEKIKLEPVVETKKEQELQETLPLPLSKNEGTFLMNEITDICTTFQAAANLPGTTNIQQNPSFYIEEILRALNEFNIIVD